MLTVISRQKDKDSKTGDAEIAQSVVKDICKGKVSEAKISAEPLIDQGIYIL